MSRLAITLISFLISFSCSVGTAQPQAIIRYRQCNTSELGTYQARQLVQMNNDGDVLIHPPKRAFIRLSIPKRSADELHTPQELLFNEYMYAVPGRRGAFGAIRSFEWTGFAWTNDSGIVERPLPASSVNVHSSVHGPMAIESNGYFSLDEGRSWSKPKKTIVLAAGEIMNGAIPVKTAEDKPNRWLLLLPDRPDTLFLAWSSKTENVRTARFYSVDSLMCLSNDQLLVASIGDTNFRAIDSLMVGGVFRALKPRYIEQLADSSILYCDSRGWYGVIRNMRIEIATSLPIGRTYIPMWQTIDFSYWLESMDDSLVVHKIFLSSPPKFETYRLPGELRIGEQGSTRSPQTFGEYGLSIHVGSSRDYIIDLHGTEAAILMYGSILDPVVDYLTQRRMIASWLDPSGVLHALDDLGNAITVDTARVGYLTHPLVTYSMEDRSITVIGSIPPKGRSWRETGTPLPTVWNSSMIFPGPVIRRFTLDGRLRDTLVLVPVCFASTIDDSILATGTKGVVRLQTSTRFDTTLLAAASNIVADTIGYPSSMTRARDGALVLTVLGTSFLHRDSAEATQRRWGGILRSTNDGKTWATVSIPSTGSYIMHCMHTSSGALVASSMLMVEDSTHPVDLNAPESYYTASNIEVMRSTDDGRTWSVTGTAFYSGPFQPCTGNIIETAPAVLYAATLAGVMISSDDGRTWHVDEQLPATAQPASVSRGSSGVLVATTQGVYEIPTTTSVHDDTHSLECKPMALTRTALRRLMQQTGLSSLLLCDVTGRTISITLTSDLAALPTGLYTVLDRESAVGASVVLLHE